MPPGTLHHPGLEYSHPGQEHQQNGKLKYTPEHCHHLEHKQDIAVGFLVKHATWKQWNIADEPPDGERGDPVSQRHSSSEEDDAYRRDVTDGLTLVARKGF